MRGSWALDGGRLARDAEKTGSDDSCLIWGTHAKLRRLDEDV